MKKEQFVKNIIERDIYFSPDGPMIHLSENKIKELVKEYLYYKFELPNNSYLNKNNLIECSWADGCGNNSWIEHKTYGKPTKIQIELFNIISEINKR